MKRLAALALALALAACSAGGLGSEPPDGMGHPSDAQNSQCSVQLQLTPTAPQVGVDPAVRATASVLDVTGAITYAWQATLDGAPTEADPAAADDSAIDIPVTTAGTLHVLLALPDQPACASATADVTILPTTFATASYRLRVTPPAAAGVPASDQIVLVHGGVDTVLPVGLAAGLAFAGGTVVDGSGAGVAAYVRMTPVGAPTAIVEAYASVTGALPTLHVLGEMHSALIVPTDPALAPRVLPWQPGASGVFAVGPGTAVTGVVRDPSGAALAGAAVALMIDGVPSSVGVTSAAGAFTLHATPSPGATIAILVTPPAASGLPRLVAASTAIALDAPWAIAYAAGLATRDLSAVHVTRAGAPVANATVAIVGSLASAGTITAGAVALTAAGDVRIATTTSAAGVLAGRAPAAPLALVVTRDPTDVALAAFDLTTAAPASVATAAPVAITGHVGLAGVQIDATGSGALAGVEAQAISDGSGAFSIPLAAGGSYALALSDPAGRAAPLARAIPSAAATDLGALALPAAVHLAGTITVAGATGSLAGTAVQLLCAACTGAAATTPLAETAADANGRFRLAVPDPDAPGPGSAR